MKITTCLFCATLGLLASVAVAAPEVQWKLKYTEDFNGRALNTKLWQRISPTPHPPPWQRYLSTREDLARVEKGVLQLRGVVNEDKAGDPRDYLCGGIWTKDRLAVKYGKIEAKVRFEDQQGAWPAFWLLPQKSGAAERRAAGLADDSFRLFAEEPGRGTGALPHGEHQARLERLRARMVAGQDRLEGERRDDAHVPARGERGGSVAVHGADVHHSRHAARRRLGGRGRRGDAAGDDGS